MLSRQKRISNHNVVVPISSHRNDRLTKFNFPNCFLKYDKLRHRTRLFPYAFYAFDDEHASFSKAFSPDVSSQVDVWSPYSPPFKTFQNLSIPYTKSHGFQHLSEKISPSKSLSHSSKVKGMAYWSSGVRDKFSRTREERWSR